MGVGVIRFPVVEMETRVNGGVCSAVTCSVVGLVKRFWVDGELVGCSLVPENPRQERQDPGSLLASTCDARVKGIKPSPF